MEFIMTEAPVLASREAPLALEQISEDINDIFEIGFNLFESNYLDFEADELPVEAYEEYRDLEDIYKKCTPPTTLNRIRIESIRNLMQTYAESHR
jgi:hypothetical protein